MTASFMCAPLPFRVMTTELPSALVVVNERNAHRRITDLLRRRGHTIEDQPNGDRAVDTYVKMRRESPTVVFLSLDVAGPLNGHLVGLEIRESDPNARPKCKFVLEFAVRWLKMLLTVREQSPSYKFRLQCRISKVHGNK